VLKGEMPLPPIYDDHRLATAKRFADLKVGDRDPLPPRTLVDGNFPAFQAVSLDNHPFHNYYEYCRALGTPAPLPHRRRAVRPSRLHCPVSGR